jgi:hypothetical protein
MKKLIAISAAVALLTGASLASANTSKWEAKCKDMATKDNISADKMDDYVKTCVKKHSMKHKMKKKTTSSTSSTSSSTSTTTTTTPAPADNMSNMNMNAPAPTPAPAAPTAPAQY